jgi:hypothetical protein
MIFFWMLRKRRLWFVVSFVKLCPLRRLCFNRTWIYSWGGKSLPTNAVKNLGVFFDESETGLHLVNHILRQVCYSLRLLYHFNHICAIKTEKRLIQSLVFPYFDYGDLVFFNMKRTLEAKLEVAQNYFIRFIYSLRRGDSISSYLMWLGFSNLNLDLNWECLFFFTNSLGLHFRHILEIFLFFLIVDTRYRFCNLESTFMSFELN